MTEPQYIAAMKSANAALERQDKQIVELKKERDEFHDSLVTVELLVSDYRIANAELEKERDEMGDKLAMASLLCRPESLQVHNLEQQAKAVKYLTDNESSIFRLFNGNKRTAIFSADANRRYFHLKNQAKALKGNNQ